MVTSCLGTAFYNPLLEERWKEEVTGRRGRRLKQLLDDLKETGGYWNLEQKEPERTMCRTHFA
jgi:hypothetical protein